jgi:hypothetical protein
MQRLLNNETPAEAEEPEVILDQAESHMHQPSKVEPAVFAGTTEK